MACGTLLLGMAATAAAQLNMKDGLWETTMKTEMAGMPGGAPVQTMQRCYTAADFQDPAAMNRGMDKGARCDTTDYRLQGNTATWKIACTGEGAMTGTGTATYGGTSYTMTNRMAMTHSGQTMNMTTTQTGKYLGPCKK
jgi:hypothetical protein